MKIRILACLILLLSLTGLFAAHAEPPADFIRVSGRKLIDGNGMEFISRGIQFSNAYSYWEISFDKARLDHDESSYAEIAALGFNTVRFSIDKRHFDTDEGWAWMDENIAWARKYGIRLIPTLHVFPPSPMEECEAYWSDATIRQVYIDFWAQYAAHYKDEPVILGYDLLNEPPVYVYGGDYTTARNMWIAHANDMIDAIRSVDPYHIIFLEGMYSVVNTATNPYTSTWHENFPENVHLFKVDDRNVVYSIHNYFPSSFAMQDMDWHGSAGMFAVYPDDLVWIIPEGVTALSSLPAGTTTHWTTLTTTYTAPRISQSRPM